MHCMPTLPNFKHKTPNSPRHVTVSLLSCLPLLSSLSSSLLDIYLPLITSIFFPSSNSLSQRTYRTLGTTLHTLARYALLGSEHSRAPAQAEAPMLAVSMSAFNGLICAFCLKRIPHALTHMHSCMRLPITCPVAPWAVQEGVSADATGLQ